MVPLRTAFLQWSYLELVCSIFVTDIAQLLFPQAGEQIILIEKNEH